MMNICESAIKIVNGNKPKWLTGLSRNRRWGWRLDAFCRLVATKPPGREQASNPAYFSKRNVETPYRSRLWPGQRIARYAYGGAGLGCRNKRMTCCNGADTGLNVPRRESEPTSGGSFVAREFARTVSMRESK